MTIMMMGYGASFLEIVIVVVVGDLDDDLVVVIFCLLYDKHMPGNRSRLDLASLLSLSLLPFSDSSMIAARH